MPPLLPFKVIFKEGDVILAKSKEIQETEVKVAEATVSAAVKSSVNVKKEDYVKIKLPKERRGEDNYIIVSVNCKSYKIMKGVWVEVPKFVAEVIENAETAEMEAEKFIENNVENR